VHPASTRIRALVLAAAISAAVGAHAALAETNFGHFVGSFVAEFGNDGRKVTLKQPFGYVDPAGITWDVPDGYQTDGASVPTVLWALYPPFTGEYRSAAVIHDYYCDTKERSWEDTHKVFYFAMRAANVAEKTAKIMYAAVYMFGPRWGPGTGPGQRNASLKATPEQQEVVVKELEALVDKENPDLDRLLAEGKRMSVKATSTLRPE
jgi:hypothetical protein